MWAKRAKVPVASSLWFRTEEHTGNIVRTESKCSVRVPVIAKNSLSNRDLFLFR